MYAYNKDDYSFPIKLKEGQSGEDLVFQKLEDEGFLVDYPEEGGRVNDLLVTGYIVSNACTIQAFRPIHIEVKGHPFSFTSINTYPYKWVTVNRAQCWNEKTTKPTLTLIVSQVTGYAFGIPINSCRSWVARECWNSKRQQSNRDIQAPRFCCQEWDEVVDYLQFLIDEQGGEWDQ